MPLEIRYQDGLSPFLNTVISEKPQWVGSALKSAGYWSQKQIKAGIRSGAPGGVPYSPLIPAWARRKIDAALGHDARRTYNPLGKLRNAVGYDKTRASEGVVTVGWLSQSAVMIGTKQEMGFFNQVSDHMRRAFAAAGFPIADNRDQIQIVARPTYGPMQPIIQAGAPKQVELKLINYLQGASKRSAAKSDRVYKVYT
ncbi:MAG: hypothetical protein E6713_02965 [Sporomusaceae bacterium]|nr:hypothetical protein [Sporomusaceae bacterium]